MREPKAAPLGDFKTYTRSSFKHRDDEHGELEHDVYRKGRGPAVVVITEMPGLSAQVFGFADRLVEMGLSVALPHLFGRVGSNLLQMNLAQRGLYMASSLTQVCISREFTLLAGGKSHPVTNWLRALAAHEHDRCGGPGVGVVGMCFTGGFALAMATDPSVIAPVLSQPSMPALPTARAKRSIDSEPETLAIVSRRCAKEGLKVLGLRFKGDPLVPGARFQYLRDQLGDGFIGVELEQADGHPRGPLPRHHSVLTMDLIDEPGSATRKALEQVLELFRTKLLPQADLHA